DAARVPGEAERESRGGPDRAERGPVDRAHRELRAADLEHEPGAHPPVGGERGIDLGRPAVGLELREPPGHLLEGGIVETGADLAERLEAVAGRVVDREQEGAVAARPATPSLERANHDAVARVGEPRGVLSLVLDPPVPASPGAIGAALLERLR